ncbi:hypothetical protein GCM10010912_03160 [Paenibacillus albidus]|uniref:DUF2812 domain-containing protein n=1 Tax=Paenibacillus albidus TaxID=2041023 RepID=A0A917BYI8_9BACL|nr:DUF2812 domain-containing protein [Paenibacillus albidus]GGF61310.1 hypothetical protein GCM10010912_03160 [Paenibacillus albidus]
MKKRVFKIFINALESQENWLNSMGSEGWRLVQVKQSFYTFETCKPGEFIYKIQFVADQSMQQLNQYKDYLGDLGIRHFSQGLNIGKFAIGNKRWRPYGKGATSFASLPGNINSELLIMEKRNDGIPFRIFSERGEEIKYYSKMRNAFSIAAVLLTLTFFISNPSPYSLIAEIYRSGVVDWRIIFKIIIIVLLMPFCRTIFTFTRKIRHIKQEGNLYE